ncbi:MAG: GNAT family N-acetyltransferase [Verrucomicrobiota bacterium]
MIASALQPLPLMLHDGPNIQVERIDPLTGSIWDSLVASRHDHSAFHLSAWARVLAEAYGHRPFYLRFIIDGENAALVPLMEVCSPLTGRRGVSLPFSDFAGPLWIQARHKPAIYQELLALAAQRKWKHLELRGGSSPVAGATYFRTYHTHELDLRSGSSQLASQFPASTRRSIRKAERSGLTITIRHDARALPEFYQLHDRTRRRHGLPPQPFGFFQVINRHMIEPGLGTVVLAKHAGMAVAGAVFFHSGGRTIYKYGASDKSHWALRPNHGVMWNAIQYLAESGCQTLDFGRTSNDAVGLLHFKQSWGASDTTLSYFRYHSGKQTWISDTLSPAKSLPLVFAHLPLALNRIAGRLIYPHLD